jgi:hypothetical protein
VRNKKGIAITAFWRWAAFGLGQLKGDTPLRLLLYNSSKLVEALPVFDVRDLTGPEFMISRAKTSSYPKKS